MMLVFIFAARPSIAVEATVDSKPTEGGDWSVTLPRIPPTEASEAQQLFTIQPDVRLELVATEPLVADPVAMAFDDTGSLYVVEMRGYSEQGEDHLGRIRRLTDVDGDGVFDQSTIFVEGLSWPTAVCCWNEGIYVAAAPDILFLRDSNGNGLADAREVIFTGLGRSNVQGLVNSFQWGLDNRIYAAVSSSGAELKHVAAPEGGTLSLHGRDFCFDPQTHLAQPTTGGGQHGMCFNRWGDRFVCSNSDHLQAIVFEERYLQKNQFQAAPGPRRSIAADGPQAEVFRTSKVEQWRVVRTKMRVSGYAPGLIEGGGRASGYFTSATGLTIDEGGLNPDHNALVADVGSNLIHRKRLVPDGVTYRGERIDRDSELISSSDNWFRPVQMCIGPEGAIYVADMYREVIEHPLSLPPEIKQQLDLTSGQDRGRVYRIVPAGYKQQTPRSLRDTTSADLVDELEHPNMWRRSTAARLIYQRQDTSLVPLLQSRLANCADPMAKISILYALAGLNALQDQQLMLALEDPHPQVRRHGLRLAEPRLDTSRQVFEKACTLVNDTDPVVQFQCALSLGACEEMNVAFYLADLVRHSDNADVIAAALVSAHSCAGAMLSAVIEDNTWAVERSGRKVIAALTAQIVRQQIPADVQALEELLRRPEQPALVSPQAVVIIALGPLASEGDAAKDHGPLAELAAAQRDALENYLPRAKAALNSNDASLGEQCVAIQLLALGDLEPTKSLFVRQLTNPGNNRIPAVLITALKERRSSTVAAVLLSAWTGMTPEVRDSVANVLCSRDDWAKQLLQACEDNQVQFTDLPPTCAMLLCNSPNDLVRQRAQKLRGANDPADRQAVYHDYLDVFNLTGDPDRGAAVFSKNCATCHQVQGRGYAIGPNLSAMANRGAETLLYNILIPNAEIDPRYASYTIVTSDGKVLTGLVAAETASSVTLKGAQGEVSTVLRVDVDMMRNTNVSLMPEKLETSIDKSAMADLLAFILESAHKGKESN